MKHLLVFLALSFFVGCSEQIPPAHKGKILTKNGYLPEIHPPSRVWTYNFMRPNDNLVIIETGTSTVKEPMSVIMQDKLTLSFDVRFRGRIDGSTSILNAMFNDVSPVERNGSLLVSFKLIYNTYGKMIVRNKSREVLSQYSVEDVHKNYKRISDELRLVLETAFKTTPIKVSDVALGNVVYPAVITEAVESAKQRDLQIAQEEAQVKIEMTKKAGEEQLAKADYRIRMLKAKTIRDENKTISEGITKDLLKLKALDVQRAMADNKSAVFVPYESMNEVGVSNRIYSR